MKNVKKLQLINFISGMYFYTPVMSLFLLQQNISIGFLVAAQTAFSVAMMLGELPTGVLADRFGQKVSIRLGLLLDALGMVQLLLVRNNAALIAYFLVRGISVAFRSGSDEALLYDSYLKENGSAKGYSKAFAKFLSNEILGFIAATAIAGIAVQIFGAASYIPLIIASGLATLLAFGLTFGVKTSRHIAKKQKDFSVIQHVKQSFTTVKKSRTILALTVAGLLTLNGEYFLRQSYQPFFQDMSVPAIFLGVALSIGKILNFLAIKYSHKLEEIWTVDRIILYINLALGLSFVGLSLSRSPWMLVPTFIFAQALFNAERPVVSDYVNQRIEPHQRSTVLSSISFIQNLGQVLARILLGTAIGLWGIGYSFAAQGMYLIVGALIGVWYLRRCGCVHRVTEHAARMNSTQVETM